MKNTALTVLNFLVEYKNVNGDLHISFAGKALLLLTFQKFKTLEMLMNLYLKLMASAVNSSFQKRKSIFCSPPQLGQIVLHSIDRFPSPMEETTKRCVHCTHAMKSLNSISKSR